MAIVKFNNRKNSTTGRSANKLKRAIDYVTDLNKTCNDLIGGSGVNKDNALDRMNTVKRYYNKCGGREYIHFVVSFKGQQDADAVYFLAENIADLYMGFQVLFAVHLNTANTHIHFVVNSVNVNDGHKFSQSKGDLKRLKGIINRLADSCGLNSDEVMVEESEYSDFEEADLGYNEDELIEPMIFFETEGLVKPLIPDYEADEYNG